MGIEIIGKDGVTSLLYIRAILIGTIFTLSDVRTCSTSLTADWKGFRKA